MSEDTIDIDVPDWDEEPPTRAELMGAAFAAAITWATLVAAVETREEMGDPHPARSPRELSEAHRAAHDAVDRLHLEDGDAPSGRALTFKVCMAAWWSPALRRAMPELEEELSPLFHGAPFGDITNKQEGDSDDEE